MFASGFWTHFGTAREGFRRLCWGILVAPSKKADRVIFNNTPIDLLVFPISKETLLCKRVPHVMTKRGYANELPKCVFLATVFLHFWLHLELILSARTLPTPGSKRGAFSKGPRGVPDTPRDAPVGSHTSGYTPPPVTAVPGSPGGVPPFIDGGSYTPPGPFPLSTFLHLNFSTVFMTSLPSLFCPFSCQKVPFLDTFSATQHKTSRQDKTRNGKTKSVNSYVFYHMNHKVHIFDIQWVFVSLSKKVSQNRDENHTQDMTSTISQKGTNLIQN